jgi:acyl-CoA synthetase (NDP forming)
MLAAATADQYGQAVRLVAGDPNIDGIVSVFLPPLATRPEDVARAVAEAARDFHHSKPVLAVFMSSGDLPDLATADGGRIPGYRMPEPAAIALAHAVRYAEWRARALEPPHALHNTRSEEAGLLLQQALRDGGGWLDPDAVRQLLGLYGVPMVDQRVVESADDAASAAAELTGEVALKVILPGVAHKSDVGGVRLHLSGEQAVQLAAREMEESVRKATGQQPTGFLVQQMVPGGVEMLVGVVNDRLFGPTVACGAGGVLVELVRDVSIRLTPLTAADARSMLHELRSFPLLTGYRGGQTCDVSALEDVLLRIGAVADDHPTIAEMDCNPVIVTPSGAVVVDARVRVEGAPPRRPLGARS